MTVKAKLWTYKPKDNGECDVKIYVSSDGQYRHFSTGIGIDPADWDEKKACVKKSNPFHLQYNNIIRRKTLEIQEAILSGIHVNDLGKKKNEPVGSIIQFVETYRREIAEGLHQIAKGTEANYSSLLTRLGQYCAARNKKDLLFSEIDQEFYNDFWRYLSAEHSVNKPGFSKHIKNLKKFMREALERGLHDNRAFLGKNFKVFREVQGIKIFLTNEEIQRMQELDLSKNSHLEIERDRFLINYFFLLRFSDGLKIVPEGFIHNNGIQFFNYRSQKTGIEVTIPVKPAAREILERYGYCFPKTTNQEANRKLKMIASMAGIEAKAKDGQPKWTHVTTHTARRSAATNLFLSGANIKMIGQLGGWNNLETLRSYLLASGIDVAKVAADLDFFK